MWGVSVLQALHLKCLTWQPTLVLLLHSLPGDLKYEGTTNRKMGRGRCCVVGFHWDVLFASVKDMVLSIIIIIRIIISVVNKHVEYLKTQKIQMFKITVM